MIFCVTGNRPEKFPFDYYDTGSREMNMYHQKIDGLLKELRSRGFDHVITGMARGVDLDVAMHAINMGGMLLEAAVPFRNQAEKYSDNERKVYDFVLSRADKVTIVNERYSLECYFDRNRYMVDKADLVAAFWNGENSGGTYYTINYAKEKQKETRCVSLSGIKRYFELKQKYGDDIVFVDM